LSLLDLGITIEGNASIAFTEDVAARFLAYGWNVLRVADANDVDRIEHTLEVFKQTRGRPTFIVLDSHIGYGSPHKQDTAAAHGEPLGDDEVRLCKRAYGWPEDAKFLVPDGVREYFAAGIGKRGADARAAWTKRFTEYGAKFPEMAMRSTKCRSANSRPDGIATFRPSRPITRSAAGDEPAKSTVIGTSAGNLYR
jgi:transketolase